jgi:hypothetical protein
MPAGFDVACSVVKLYAARHVAQLYVAFAKIKQLVADFPANEKFSPCPAFPDKSQAGHPVIQVGAAVATARFWRT